MATTGRIHINGEETLGHILKDKLLSMPINQREYAWTTEKHVPDLLSDLANAIALKEEYFLGSVVVTNPDSVDGRNLVIDGQQRLATTTMVIAAIRDYFVANKDVTRAGIIENEYLFSQDSRTLDTIPHLILNRVDHEYFRRRILSRPDHPDRQVKPTAESHDLIDEAAESIRKHISSVGAQFQPPLNIQRLMDWVDFIRDGARVIWLQVPDETNGFVMFQTLNDRGLAPTDLSTLLALALHKERQI